MKFFFNKYRQVEPKASSRTLNYLGILIVMLFSLVAATAWANSPGRHPKAANQDESSEPPKYLTVNTTIEKKSLKHVFTLGRDYAVNEETIIVGTNGKEVTIKKMLVPCDVVVRYLIEKGVPTAKRIDITRVASNADWRWISENPQ